MGEMGLFGNVVNVFVWVGSCGEYVWSVYENDIFLKL